MFCPRGASFPTPYRHNSLSANEVQGSGRRVTPKRYRLIRDGKVYAFNPDSNYIYIYRYSDSYRYFLDVTPARLWFRCCPPHTTMDWSDLIGHHHPYGSFKESDYEVEREAGSRIRMVRHDKGGGVMTLRFDSGFCSNLVESDFIHEKSGQKRHGTYRWRKTPEGVCVLAECSFRDRSVVNNKLDDSTYRLIIKDIDVKNPVPDSKFSVEAFEKRLPNDVLISDATDGKRRGRINPSKAYNTKALNELSDLVKSRGFLKP
ncbi:MAG TPA: hypothetical protein VG406_21285 [Isosphaeraceae bacterium]|jgi:hypothetical protein|nr:hypothetical protein [Isosphaeraceae bacterium]